MTPPVAGALEIVGLLAAIGAVVCVVATKATRPSSDADEQKQDAAE